MTTNVAVMGITYMYSITYKIIARARMMEEYFCLQNRILKGQVGVACPGYEQSDSIRHQSNGWCYFQSEHHTRSVEKEITTIEEFSQSDQQSNRYAKQHKGMSLATAQSPQLFTLLQVATATKWRKIKGSRMPGGLGVYTWKLNAWLLLEFT